MRKALFYFPLAFLLFACSSSRSTMKRAEAYFFKHDYTEALPLYQKLARKKGTDDAKLRAATCYIHLHEPDKVVFWYSQVELFDKADPWHHFQYGKALFQCGRYDEAKVWFERYGQEVPHDKSSRKQVYAIEHLEEFHKDSLHFEIRKLDINSRDRDFAPAYFKEGIVFVSNRDWNPTSDRRSLETNERFFDLYFSKTSENGSQIDVNTFADELNGKFHEGPVCFNNEENRIIFTRSEKEPKLYTAKLIGNKWTNIRPMRLNFRAKSMGHPAVSADFKTLVFVADVTGMGQGGADLYISHFKNGRWSTPENLGTEINSPGQEMFPFIHTDGSLYFASDGKGGLGGLDIFYCEWKDGEFATPKPLSYPINTHRDDFGLVLSHDGRTGYLSSDREGGQGLDDIYGVIFTEPNKTIVQGRIMTMDGHGNSFPVRHTKVVAIDNYSKDTMLTKVTDNLGDFTMRLESGRMYSLACTEQGFLPLVKNLDLNSEDRYHHAELVLQKPLPTGVPFQTIVKDKDSGLPVKMAKVSFRDSTEKEIVLYTDDQGIITTQLKPNMPYDIRVGKTKYINNYYRIETEQATTTTQRPIQELSLERISAQKILLAKKGVWQSGNSELNADVYELLDKVAIFAKNHPGVKLQVNVYTDSRGNSFFNMRNSQTIARRALEFLQHEGVSRRVIQARGFGEEALLNHCGNGIDCSEEEHLVNNRIEITIIDYNSKAVQVEQANYDWLFFSPDAPFLPLISR